MGRPFGSQVKAEEGWHVKTASLVPAVAAFYTDGKSVPQGLKPVVVDSLLARLKPCPSGKARREGHGLSIAPRPAPNFFAEHDRFRDLFQGPSFLPGLSLQGKVRLLFVEA